jgi:hypothetical protein
MSDFLVTYTLTRGRLDDLVGKMSSKQLNFRLHPDSLTAGEMALHIAGVEVWFVEQLTGIAADPRLAKCATDGSINDNPFPYSTEEITPEFVASKLAEAKEVTTNLLSNMTDEVRSIQIKSALGPVIDGNGAAARLCSHPFYHQGQIYLISTAPEFPTE